MPFRSEAHRTGDGAEVAYRVRPGRDVWVFLHGLGCDGSMWDGVIDALPGDAGVLIPDLRGHGASTLGFGLPSVDRWARDVAEILEKERIERPAVAGLSMGGYAAFALAAAFPGLARAHAFVSTSAAPDDDAGRMRRAEGLALLRREGWRVFAAGLVPSLLVPSRPDFESHRAHLLAMFERAADVGLAAALFALANRPDRRPLLPSLRAPSVVVVGEADLLTPPYRAREIAQAAPRSRLLVLPGVAHMSAMEAASDVAAALAGL